MKKKEEIAVRVKNLSKEFKIPHKKIDSMRSAFVNAFSKNTYEKFNALDDISFDVKKGEFFGIIGHNGAGKSTLLKILAGVYNSDSGDIEIDGMISPFLELGIGFNPELSGRDNIYLNAAVLGLARKQIDEKFDDIVEFSELGKFIDQQLKNYSSGMRVRLAFSVSIHANRSILLMDEVLAVGDSNFQEKCLDIFRGYKRKGRTVILVTHSISTVREYCDRAMLLGNGQVLKIGEVDDVCDEYVLNNMEESDRRELEKREKKDRVEKERREDLKNFKKGDFEKVIKKDRVCGLKFLNKNNKITGKFTRDDDIRILLDFVLQSSGNDTFVGIEILDSAKNNSIYVVNTLYDGFEHNWNSGKNSLEVNIKKGCFNKGRFYLKVVLFKENSEHKKILDIYNSKDQNMEFEVITMDRRNGMIFSEHTWKQGKNEKNISFEGIKRLNRQKQ